MMQSIFLNIETIKGIGPKKLSGLHRLGIYKIIDILLYGPNKLDLYPIIYSREDLINLIANHQEQEVNVSVRVANLKKFQNHSYFNKKKIYITRGIVADLNLPIEIVFFHINSLRSIVSSEGIVRGKARITLNKISFTHPDFFASLASNNDNSNWSHIVPKYFLTEGIYDNDIAKIVKYIDIPNLQEWIPKKYLIELNLPSWKDAIYDLHFQNNPHQRDLCIKRLAFDELIFQNTISNQIQHKSEKFLPREDLKQLVLDLYGFNLTDSQQKSLEEIENDLASSTLMTRLLHGDVGSGKTIIAFLSMINVGSTRHQIAFVAPTEVLAVQHYHNFQKIIDFINSKTSSPLKVECLIGSTKPKEKLRIKNELSSGICNIVFSTHAIFQENVQFLSLNYVVIDEQHKFGVRQRLSIASKGKEVNILIMSATPIPRTLEHSICGSIQVSKIEQKIPGRIDVNTYLISDKRIDELIHYVGKLIANQNNGYWVCPSIEENEDMASVNKSYQKISEILSNYVDVEKIGLLHGKMKPAEKNQVVENFKNGTISLLISTTIIEIGIDVPSATFIVIENAERFGLAQLHQLRGRVGRNNIESSCFLVYKLWSSKIKERLNTIKNTTNGFEIAQKDLELRGAGEYYGYQQSGIFEMFNFVNYQKHQDIIDISKNIRHEISNNSLKILQQIMEHTKATSS
jgi:ATP-dependent DNA helicase RecG